MGMMVYTLLWVMHDLYHQPYFVGFGVTRGDLGVRVQWVLEFGVHC